jgi:hypothetical protein
VNSGDRIVARATLLAFLRFRKGFDSPSDPKLSIRMVAGFAEVVERKEFFGCGGLQHIKTLGTRRQVQ